MRVLFNSQVAEIAAEHSPLVIESAEDTISRLEEDAVHAYEQHNTTPGRQDMSRFLNFKHQYIAAHI